jgi:acetyltransferase
MKLHSVPAFSYPEVAVGAFKKLCEFSAARKKEQVFERFVIPENNRTAVREMIHEMRATGHSEFGDDSSMQILLHYGFTFPQCGLSRTAREAAVLGKRIGFPVVMKISSPDILHKTDVGGVIFNIESAEAASDAFVEITANATRFMPDAYLKGVTVYEMVKEGKEVILGVTYDRTFGHMIMFGLGGIYVEVLKDVSFRIAPVSRDEAADMVNDIRSISLLRGVRGESPADIGAIVEAIMRVSALVTDFPEIRELDINPLKVKHKGALALDSRIIFELPA